MLKFDSDNTDHISLLNRLVNKAAAHFAGDSVYYSDCLRDVEHLYSTPVGTTLYWLIGATATVLVCDRLEAKDLLVNTYCNKAMYKITHCATKYGTSYFNIELAE